MVSEIHPATIILLIVFAITVQPSSIIINGHCNLCCIMCTCIAGLADVQTQIIISRNTSVALSSKNEMKIKVLRGKSEILQREVERLIATSLKMICIQHKCENFFLRQSCRIEE